MQQINITISEDPNNKSLLIIRAIIEPNQEQSCSFTFNNSS
jgi:hypothetical protein